MTQDSTLLERIDDVDAFVAEPGTYHTTTGHQAYGVIQALDGHPHVRLGEELYFTEGSVLFVEVVAPEMTPNVEKIAWGTEPDFFERRLRDYDAWEIAFWRELLQNSRDAGATRVDIRCEPGRYEDPESGESVDCVVAQSRDDGRGMDQETLMRAFFRRGGSQKDVGSVGGFGDAKNLILTPWLGYEVRTQDVRARGRHEDIFAPIETGLSPLRGTEVTVWMPSTKATTPEFAQFLIEQSSLDLAFTINGKRVDQKLPRGNLVLQKPIVVDGKTVGELLIYHSPRAKRRGVYVRSHGIYMYEFHGHVGEYKGVVTVEVNAPPIGVFTTKRDALSYNSNARSELNEFLTKLSADPKKLLKTVRDKKEIIFRGAGAIEVRRGRVAELAAEIADKIDLSRYRTGSGPDGGPVKLDKNAANKLLQQFTAKLGTLENDDDESLGPKVAPLSSTFGTLLSVGEFVNVEQVIGAMKLSMWKPDFYLYQNISPWKMPKALHPESMALKYHQLLQVWTEICKFVLVQFGMFQPFGVGWVFDTEYDYDKGDSVIAAMYVRHEGMDWLLVNPVKIRREGYGDDISFTLEGDEFVTGDPLSIEKLVTFAVHEITHMQGFSGHSDSYASALTQNMKVIFRLAPVLNRIVKEAKKAVSEERPAKKKARSPDEVMASTEERRALLPTTTVDPRFRALYALFAVAQSERARTMFHDAVEVYRRQRDDFERAMIGYGTETAWMWDANAIPDDEKFQKALRTMLEHVDRARQGSMRVTLPSDSTFMGALRWAGDEAWHAATEQRNTTPRVRDETYGLLLQVMNQVYDLTPLAKWWSAWQAA